MAAFIPGTREYVRELLGPRRQHDPVVHVPVRVHVSHVPRKPRTGGINGDIGYGKAPPARALRCPVADRQFHRPQHLASPESLFDAPRGKQALVDVMMEDGAEFLQIGLGERYGNGLHHGIAQRIGMSPAFALNDLKVLVNDRHVPDMVQR